MWFRLALKMGRTVDELQQSMSSTEFGEWIAFYSIEPFGDRVKDLRAGTVAAVVANVNRSKDTPAFAPLDFIPWAKEPEKKGPPTAEAMASLFGVNLTEAKRKGGKVIFRARQPGRG